MHGRPDKTCVRGQSVRRVQVCQNECRIKNSGAPVCDQTSGKCVGCLTNDHCTGGADGGVDGGSDGGGDGGPDGGVVAGFCYLATNQCVECLGTRTARIPPGPSVEDHTPAWAAARRVYRPIAARPGTQPCQCARPTRARAWNARATRIVLVTQEFAWQPHDEQMRGVHDNTNCTAIRRKHSA